MDMTTNKTTFKKYPAYKDSGVEWLGEIPAEWEVLKIKNVSRINTNSLSEDCKGDFEFNYVDIGNVTYEKGIVGTEKFTFRNAPSRARRIAKPKDTIISTVRTYLKAIDFISKEKSKYIFSTGFAVLEPINNKIIPQFLSSFVKSSMFTNQVDIASKGMSYPAINSTDLSNLRICIPSRTEQTAIANFLDEKTTKIDQAIAQKEQLIALLKERKQIIIQHAVTKGLDPNAKMKDSGVEWIGEIPEGWEVKKLKFLFDEINERSVEGTEELLSVSHMTGVTPRSEKDVNMFLAEDYAGSKLCRAGDVVYNIMWTWMGALGVSYQTGIVSPSYGVYRQKDSEVFNSEFLEYKFKSAEYIDYYNRVSTGLHSSRLRFYSHMFMGMEITYPNKEEQDRIIENIKTQSTKIDQAITLQQTQIQKLKEYKATLIDSAVTGKIKVI